MHKMNRDHAAKARKAIAACDFDPLTDLKDSIKDILVDVAHLCDAEGIDFVERVQKAINTWVVERIDPLSLADGPTVEITIGTEGLPEPPEPVKRPGKRDKSRPAYAARRTAAHRTARGPDTRRASDGIFCRRICACKAGSICG